MKNDCWWHLNLMAMERRHLQSHAPTTENATLFWKLKTWCNQRKMKNELDTNQSRGRIAETHHTMMAAERKTKLLGA